MCLIDMHDTIQLVPVPFFVGKAKSLNPPQSKVFVNVCHNKEVPPPREPFAGLQTFQKIMANQWEIPIVTSPKRTDVDKSHQPCIVFDCIINTDIVEPLEEYEDLRKITMEWCLESIELREDNLLIDRDSVKFPKMKYKGQLPPASVTMEIPREDGTQESEGNNPSSLLQWKADTERLEEQETTLKTLFPQGPPPNKPLIQEISREHQLKRNERVQNIQEIKESCTFDVAMRKTYDTTEYKLRIKIVGSITKLLADNLEVKYDADKNQLLVEYAASPVLKLDLPNFIKEEHYTVRNFKTFLVSNRIYIFV
ncbi:Pih1p KNAG_0B04750 [Huiozyma naganishii CBS 8797]|uniref:PIH1 N-terminal domain-containing protein n=1 Tax=Huiozyma naganishii (strain ATCC MYA-139 / BCRC 22969 / CBS 8797 / KCTC 17520 / NBRC 10181 / NCYC 3082 / Yp74L-3) TaxID=1071383 RepID=J7R268_HUIN7|nr:hypothetical protein KNAG_0B04750 [Kazachstania naganishii CBS 8797]CCK68910.1 hypothetical protein KNAG_0B04750 [Kazachstania naganishii CBS 8797]